MKYIKEVFYPENLDHAKHIALTSDPKNPNKFWEETQFIIDCLRPSAYISSESVVLDFGCGMGRLSRELISNFRCEVIGVDNSEKMRELAEKYVDNDILFKCFSSYDVKENIDIAFSLFVLQHVEFPQKEIDNLYNVIKPNGYLFLVNEKERLVPSDVDKDNYIIWKDDGFDVFAALSKKFRLIETKRYYNNHPTLEIQLFQKVYVPQTFNYSTNAF